MPFSELIHPWHDFFLLVGTAAATLVGLMFVTASIGANVFKEENTAALRAFISPTVVHFVAVLLVCFACMIPTRTWSALGSLLVIGGLIGLAYTAHILFQFLIRRRFKVDMVDRLFYALIPAIGYALILAAAGLLLAQSPLSLDVLAAALITLMIAGLRNGWDMTIWIVIKTPVAERTDSAG